MIDRFEAKNAFKVINRLSVPVNRVGIEAMK